jgi:hypothetical protein
MKKFFAVILFVLFASVACAETVKTFTAQQLLDRVERNEARFRNDFNKAGVINVTGVIDEISEMMGTLTITLGSEKPFSFSDVRINVPDRHRNWALGLDKGDKIKVAVVFTDTIIMGSPIFEMSDK